MREIYRNIIMMEVSEGQRMRIAGKELLKNVIWWKQCEIRKDIKKWKTGIGIWVDNERGILIMRQQGIYVGNKEDLFRERVKKKMHSI